MAGAGRAADAPPGGAQWLPLPAFRAAAPVLCATWEAPCVRLGARCSTPGKPGPRSLLCGVQVHDLNRLAVSPASAMYSPSAFVTAFEGSRSLAFACAPRKSRCAQRAAAAWGGSENAHGPLGTTRTDRSLAPRLGRALGWRCTEGGCSLSRARGAHLRQSMMAVFSSVFVPLKFSLELGRVSERASPPERGKRKKPLGTS